MAASTQFQVTADAAQRYQELTPYFLQPFADRMVDLAALQPGELVLDVGCGTGAATRTAALRVGPSGKVIGSDINAGMLAVAQSLPAPEGAAPIAWLEAPATAIPFPERSFDAVISSQVLQFIPERATALAEIHRVLKPGGRLAAAVWRAIDQNPYMAALAPLIAEHLSPDIAAAIQAPFGWAEEEAIRIALQEAGFDEVGIQGGTHEALLPDMESFVPNMVGATPMAQGWAEATPEARQAVVQGMVAQLAPYRTAEGYLVPFRSNLILAMK